MSGPYGMQHLKNQCCSNCKRKKLEDRDLGIKWGYRSQAVSPQSSLRTFLYKVDYMQTHSWYAPDEVSRGDIFIGSLDEYDLSIGMFFDIMPHRSEIFAGFFRACYAL